MTFKTCGSKELEQFTSSGWTVKETREEDVTEYGGSYTDQIPSGPGGFSMAVCKTHPNFPARKLVFILERDRDAEVNELREKLRVSEQNFADSKKIKDAAVTAKKQAEEASSNIRKLREAAEEELAFIQGRFKTADALRNTLETDVAKLRKEVGEKRYRELCAPPAKPGSSE